MNKLKVKFMFIVCQFLGDWYNSQISKDSNKAKRLKTITSFMEDLKTEYEEE